MGGSNISIIGGYKIYAGVNCIATIKGNGDFNCSGITCNALTAILTELNNKLSSTDIYIPKHNVMYLKQILHRI